MPRIKLTIAYVGTAFAGWQIQAENRGVIQRTVQGELEAALFGLLGRNVRLHASGRTDSGVHADMQVAHFDAPEGCGRINWPQALHSRLPGDISILAAETVADDFHARFDCREKTYTYALWLKRAYVLPKLRPFVWHCGPLNLDLMDSAAALLLGQHDFASFQNIGSQPSDTVRNLLSIDRFFAALPGEAALKPGEAVLEPDEAVLGPNAATPGADESVAGPNNTMSGPGMPFKTDTPYVIWRFRGDGFLKQMVRNLMGFLVSVGQGKLAPEAALRVLAARDRTAFDFPTAPARGLTLTQVVY